MRCVRRHSALVLAILLYVTLDLSCAAMPGAFVFDATESIEGAQGRARVTSERVGLVMPMRNPAVLAAVFARSEPPRPPEHVERAPHLILCRQCPPRQGPLRPTDEPH